MRSYGNFGESPLATGITAGAGTLTVSDIADLDLGATPTNIWGVIFEDQYHEANGGAGPGEDPNREIVEAYGYSGDVLSIRRGQQDTNASAHNSGGVTYWFRVVWTKVDAQRSQPYVDLRDYDADPSGSNLSTSAVERALDEAGGLPILVPAGTYLLDGVALDADLVGRFQGDGMGQSIFKLADDTDAPMFAGASGDIVSLLRFEGIELDGNEANQGIHDISLIRGNFDRFKARRCRFRRTSRAAFRTYAIQTRVEFSRCLFTEGRVHQGSAGNDSLYVWGENSAVLGIPPELVLDQCEMFGSTPPAAGRGTGGVTVDGTVDGANTRLVVLGGVYDTLGYNHSSNVSSPIHVYKFGDGSRVRDVRIRNTVNGAVRIQKSTDVAISGVSVKGETSYVDTDTGGAPVVNTALIEISGRSAVGGVQIDNFARVSDIYIEGVPTAGLGVLVQGDSGGEFHDVSIERAHIRGTGQGIHVAYVERRVSIARCHMDGLTKDASSRESVVVENVLDGALIEYEGNTHRNCPRRVRLNRNGTARAVHARVVGNVSDACASGSLGGCIEVDNIATLDARENYAPNLPAGAEEFVVTNVSAVATEIASGEITVGCWTGVRAVAVDTEGAASTDTLDTINGGFEGQIVVIHTVDDARDVTVASGGNIRVTSNFGLTVTRYSISLQKRGSQWVQISRDTPV